MLEHPLTAAIDPQLAFLLANLTIQLIITLRAFEARQRYLTDITDTPVSVQSLAQLARHVVLMLGAQAQFHAFAQVRVQVDLPIAQLQLPVQAHAILGAAAVEQFPVEQSRPTMGRPCVFARMTAIPRPAHRHATANRADMRPLRRAPQPRLLPARLKVQQLRALTTEHRLTQRMIDHQHVAHLIALPGEHRSLAQGFEEALQRMLMHWLRS